MLTEGLAAHPNSGAKTGYEGIIDIFLMDINMVPKSFKGFPGVSHSKESDCNAGDLGLFPGSGPLQKEMATHSNILA